jgi:hypothetical protein
VVGQPAGGDPVLPAPLAGGWQYLAAFVVVFHFAVPFLLLLSARIKRNPKRLAAVATGLLCMRWLDLYWQTMPNLVDHLSFHWLDAATMIGVGGLWLAIFARILSRAPLLPVHDPFLPEALHHE